jgi:Proteasome assembly chaperone 3
MDSLSSTLQSSRLSDVSPHPNSIPITLTRSYNVRSVVTDVWVQLFSDRIVFGISQLNTKVGSFVLCHVDESIIDNRIRFMVMPLLGKTDDVVSEVFARQVTEKIAALRTTSAAATATSCPSVMLGISLKSTDPETFHVLADLLVNLYKEAIQLATS